MCVRRAEERYERSRARSGRRLARHKERELLLRRGYGGQFLQAPKSLFNCTRRQRLLLLTFALVFAAGKKTAAETDHATAENTEGAEDEESG